MKSVLLKSRLTSLEKYTHVNCARPPIRLFRPQVAMPLLRAFDRHFRQRNSNLTERAQSDPRKCVGKNPELISSDRLIEEETIPGYDATHYYPAQMGEIFKERFQILSKLGFGSSSTIWLARDLW